MAPNLFTDVSSDRFGRMSCGYFVQLFSLPLTSSVLLLASSKTEASSRRPRPRNRTPEKAAGCTPLDLQHNLLPKKSSPRSSGRIAPPGDDAQCFPFRLNHCCDGGWSSGFHGNTVPHHLLRGFPHFEEVSSRDSPINCLQGTEWIAAHAKKCRFCGASLT
jgi:hypothetical protein